ncbi:MAG: hypothetical protein JNK35_13000 [Phycisphaerae bacterium]|nr:hypothetical protein [Phycisphaerae bacterium]
MWGLEQPNPGDPVAGLRAAAAMARGARLAGLTLLGTLTGLRARELDRSARRDIAATLRREGLVCAGIDLPVPPSHFADPAHVDRALAATREALSLAADLAKLTDLRARPVVAILLPRPAPQGAVAALEQAAEHAGCAAADLSWPFEGAKEDERGPAPGLGVALDPAAILMAGADPAAAVHAVGARLVQARWSDAASGSRIAVGAGRLDALTYRVAVELARPAGMSVADVRGLEGDAVAAALGGIVSATAPGPW